MAVGDALEDAQDVVVAWVPALVVLAVLADVVVDVNLIVLDVKVSALVVVVVAIIVQEFVILLVMVAVGNPREQTKVAVSLLVVENVAQFV